jgi:hypothetical protein
MLHNFNHKSAQIARNLVEIIPNTIRFALFILALGVSLAACTEKSPTKSTVKINVGGASAESPVFCDSIILDNSWRIMAGSLSGGLEYPPAPRALTLFSPAMSLPSHYFVHWVNKQSKKEFEAVASAPEFAAKAEALVKQYSAGEFYKTLTIVIHDSGEIQVWLDARRAPHYEEGFTELLGSFQGAEVFTEKDAEPSKDPQHEVPTSTKGE